MVAIAIALLLLFFMFAFMGPFSFVFYIIGVFFGVLLFPLRFFNFIYPVGTFPYIVLYGTFFFCLFRAIIHLIPVSTSKGK